MFTKIAAFFRRSQDIGSEEYERISILQKTNMSEVWLARRKSDRLITVTKIARVDQSRYASANQEAIYNEANWLGKFRNNPRIVQIYHSAETNLRNNPRFIAVEYLEGGTLENVLQQRTWRGRLQRFLGRNPKASRPTGTQSFATGSQNEKLYRGRLPVEQALQVFGYTAEGLALMHSQGVVHRDIKPDNIMFRRRPTHGRVIEPNNLVLIDLGIAAPLNRPAGAAVSRGWSDPRCIEARESRRKIVTEAGFDIYSLGRVLRFMVTGQRPKENTLEADLKTSIEPHLLRFSKRRTKAERARIAQQLSGLIQACLSDDIERRPAAAQLVARTDALLKELSPPPSRMRRGLALTAAAVLAALLMAAILAANPGGADSSAPLQPVTDFAAKIFASIYNMPGARADAQSQPTAPPAAEGGQASNDPAATSTPPPAEEAASTATAPPVSRAAGDAPAAVVISDTATPTVEVANIVTPTAIASATAPPATHTPTLTPTAPPPTSTPAPVVTRRPTPSRTPTNAPTAAAVSGSTPPATPPPPVVRSARVTTIEVLQENESHACTTGSPDTWHFDVRLLWRYKDGNQPLPAASTFEVVTWLDNGDPLNPGQAYTIHGPSEIIQLDNGRFSLERKPTALAPVFTRLKGGALAADTLYKWGIVQVTQGRRVALLTPGEGCKFVLHADILKK
ncbi:MAG: protein kinase [Caldilineaceae bacterium]